MGNNLAKTLCSIIDFKIHCKKKSRRNKSEMIGDLRNSLSITKSGGILILNDNFLVHSRVNSKDSSIFINKSQQKGPEYQNLKKKTMFEQQSTFNLFNHKVHFLKNIKL